MHAEAPGQPPVVGENEDRAREILEGHEACRQEQQQQAAREVLEDLLHGQPPLTAEEIEAAEREWWELHSTPPR